MKLAIGIALFVIGLCLTVWGASAADSLASEASEVFTGSPTDEAMWLLIGGIGAMAGGATLVLLGIRRRAST